MPSPNMISVQQLSRLIGTDSAPILIDVCIDADFEVDPRLIPTAVRVPFTAMDDLASTLGHERVVVICQKGLKLSQGAAAILRTHGFAAEALAGGNIAWRDAGQPLVPASLIPDRVTGQGTLWVTRHRPKVDRIACAWLIRRFVDRDARFLFVSPSEVPALAERFGATPFDVPDACWSHRGDRCTFDTMLEGLCLQTDPLRELAAIVRGADTNRLNLTPQSAGLLAASLGLSRQFRDDLQQLQAGLVLYDAFYRWCRDAMDERHD